MKYQSHNYGALKRKVYFVLVSIFLLITNICSPAFAAAIWPADPAGEDAGGTMGNIIYPEMQNKKLSIGTDVPAGSLDIFGTGKRAILTADSESASTDCGVDEEKVYLDSTGILPGFTISGQTITSVGSGYVCTNDDSIVWLSGSVKWWQDPATRFMVDSNGNVGIGTGTPLEKLHITGGGILTTAGDPDPLLAIGGNGYVSAKDLDVVGDYIYVVSSIDTDLNIVAYDGSSLENVSIVTDSEWSYINDVVISGDYAYIGHQNGFAVVDISNKKSPVALANIDYGLNSSLEGVFLSGKYIFATGADSVYSIDVSDPANPFTADKLLRTEFAFGSPERSILTETDDIVVSGDYAYLTSNNDGMIIIDVSDPTDLSVAGYLEQTDETTAMSEAEGIAVYGDYAFIGGKTDDGLEVVDVSDPADPQHVTAIFDVENAAYELDDAQEVRAHWPYLYMTAIKDDGVQIFDITDPENPVHAGSITDTASTELDGANGIFVSGKNIYVVGYYDDGLTVLETQGIDTPAATIYSLETSLLMVNQNADIKGSLVIGTALNVGSGGIQSQGSISISSGISYFGGNVGVGTLDPQYALEIEQGDMHVENGGSYRDAGNCEAGFCLSDRNLKTDIIPLSGSLQKIMDLNPVTFRFLDEYYGKGLQTGLIAQEVEEIFPDWVTTGADGYKKVRYGQQINMHLIQAIKELDADLDAELTALEEENKRLEAEISALEAEQGL